LRGHENTHLKKEVCKGIKKEESIISWGRKCGSFRGRREGEKGKGSTTVKKRFWERKASHGDRGSGVDSFRMNFQGLFKEDREVD